MSSHMDANRDMPEANFAGGALHHPRSFLMYSEVGKRDDNVRLRYYPNRKYAYITPCSPVLVLGINCFRKIHVPPVSIFRCIQFNRCVGLGLNNNRHYDGRSRFDDPTTKTPISIP